jgi:murein DD-endopeptidase MepM/ murein hydrolase activator NlpD
MKKSFSCCMLSTIGLSLVCIAGFFLITYAVAAEVADSLPWPLNKIAWEWIEGDPKPVGHPALDYQPVSPDQVIESGSYYFPYYGYTGPGSMICRLPVEYGYFVSSTGGFGETYKRNGHPHTGIDYGTNGKDEGVLAVMGGQVTHAGWSYWLGWTVVIENDGVQLILGHLCCGPSGVSGREKGHSSIVVNEGDVISAGTVVGRAGNTGNSDGVHLHLEVRVCDEEGKCKIIDPRSIYLPGQNTYCDWQGFETLER